MTMEEFNEGFGMLLDYYPNTRVTDGLVNIYYMGLAELSITEFNRAIGKIVKEYDSDFLPKVSMILKYANSGMDLTNQVILAKKMLKRAIEKVGRTGMIAFEDKGVQAVVDYAGWLRLCNMSIIEFENFMNWEFEKIYKDFMSRPYSVPGYFRGTQPMFGQKEPKLITYAMVGVRSNESLNFIPLGYKTKKETGNKLDYKSLKKKMLIGG